MLWDLIFDFFIVHIFGGQASDHNLYTGFVGYYWNGTSYTNYGTHSIGVYTVNVGSTTQTMLLGNYLSLIATIITLVIILLVIGHFIKKLFNLFGRII